MKYSPIEQPPYGARYCSGAGTDAEALAHCARGAAMVPRDHLHADSRFAADLHRRHRLLARRVDDAHQAQQDEAGVRILEAQSALFRLREFNRQRQGALTLDRHLFLPRQPVLSVDRLILVCISLPQAARHDGLVGPLEIDESFTLMVVMQGGHETMLGFERDQVAAR